MRTLNQRSRDPALNGRSAEYRAYVEEMASAYHRRLSRIILQDVDIVIELGKRYK